MNRLPEPNTRQPHVTQAGQPTDEALYRAAQIAAAVDAVYDKPTYYRDPTPVPAIGTALPVPQPGRPPMSQRAVDLNTTILTSSVLTAVLGGSTTAVLWASGHADPTVIAWICASAVAVPTAFAVPILALSRLVKRTKETIEAAPPVIHQHYTGNVTVDGRTVNSTTRGIWASTRNQLPPGTSR